jgi:S1-C subfamily serine protease
LKVIFTNGTEGKAEIIGFDEYSNLAVIKMDSNVSISQSPLQLGESANSALQKKFTLLENFSNPKIQ